MMSSSSNPDPWSPYETYKDCSVGICSRYCPQWCYVIFPPPPPDEDGPEFSPLVIAVIGILASAFLLVTYYALVSRYCRRRTTTRSAQTEPQSAGEPGLAGLEEALIKTIRVCKYKKSDGFVEGTDCSVCLTEFVEDESLRLLPKCNHAFHLPCIDTWLKSQATCPLCRSALSPLPLPPPRVSAMQHRPGSDVVVFVRDLERVVVLERGTEGSDSSVDHHQQQVVLISDILQEIQIHQDEDVQVELENPEKGSLSRFEIGEGNSKSGVKVKRSKFARHGKNCSSTVIHT